MSPDLQEIYVEHIYSHLLKNKLEQNGIEFKIFENSTGNFSEPFQSFFVSKENLDIAYRLLDDLSTNEGNEISIKYPWFYRGFMWLLTLATISILVFFTNLLLNDHSTSPEIWIAYVIALLLSALGFYVMYKSGAYFGKLK